MLKEKVKKAIKETEKVRTREKGKSSWWDEECRRERTKLRKYLHRFRKRR